MLSHYSPRKIPPSKKTAPRGKEKAVRPGGGGSTDLEGLSDLQLFEKGALQERLWVEHGLATRSDHDEANGPLLVVDHRENGNGNRHWLNEEACRLYRDHGVSVCFRMTDSGDDLKRFFRARVELEKSALIGPYSQIAGPTLMEPGFLHEVVHVEEGMPAVQFVYEAPAAVSKEFRTAVIRRVYGKRKQKGKFFRDFKSRYGKGFFQDEAEAVFAETRYMLDLVNRLSGIELPLESPSDVSAQIYLTYDNLNLLPSTLYHLEMFLSMQLRAIENLFSSKVSIGHKKEEDFAAAFCRWDGRERRRVENFIICFSSRELKDWARSEYAKTEGEIRKEIEDNLVSAEDPEIDTPFGALVVWAHLRQKKLLAMSNSLGALLPVSPLIPLIHRAHELHHRTWSEGDYPAIKNPSQLEEDWKKLASGIAALPGLDPV